MSEVLASEDATAMIAAARQLWITPRERDDGEDIAVGEVWRALEKAGAIERAVAAGLAVVLDRKQLRTAAFIDLVEAIGDPTTILELAEIALATKWPTDQLAATFARLVELEANKSLVAFIEKHWTALRATPELFALVGFTLVGTKTGSNEFADRWFRGWEERTGVPMWLVSAYLANLSFVDTPLWRRYRIARTGLERCTLDDTAAYLLSIVLFEDATAGRDDAFVALFNSSVQQREFDATRMFWCHPMLQYANRAKRKQPIDRLALEWYRPDPSATSLLMPALPGLPLKVTSLIALAAQGSGGPRPPDWRTVEQLRNVMIEQGRIAELGGRFLGAMAEMLALPKGHHRGIDLYREVRKLRPRTVPMVMKPWARISKKKLGWLRRLRLEYE